MRTTFVGMCVFNYNRHEQGNFFYMKWNRRISKRGVSKREGERERDRKGPVLRKKGLTLVINSFSGIYKQLYSLGKDILIRKMAI